MTFAPSPCMKVVHVLNMGTARLHSFPLSPDESVNSLQTRVERETGVAARDQEILLKVGVSLDPRKPARQCVTEGLVREREREKERERKRKRETERERESVRGDPLRK